MAERRQERRFFRPERAAGRSRTRGCGLVELGVKSQLASLLLHFVSKSVETLSFFQVRASSNRARSFFSAAAYASLPSKSRNGGVPFLRQLDDRLSCLSGVTRPLAVVVPLKSCGSSNRRIVFRMTFAEFGGTAREVCAKAARFNNGDLDAERCHFARKDLGEAFDTPLRRRIRPTSRRANPSAHR